MSGTTNRRTPAAELFQSCSTGTKNLVLNPAEALTAISILATAADGNFSDEEKWILSANHVRLFHTHSPSEFQGVLNKVFHLIRQHSCATVFAASKIVLNRKQRESAFAMAADLVLADGILTAEEKEFLLQLWHALEIDDQMGEKILDVMTLKNCCEYFSD